MSKPASTDPAPADPNATPPAGTDPTPPADPAPAAKPEDNGAKGKPDEDAKAARLQAELDAAKQQAKDLQEALDQAKTADEVQKAVDDAKAAAQKQVKEIAVNAHLTANGCLNTKALIAAAGIDVDKAEVASDGSVISGVDIKKCKTDFPYLFPPEGDPAPNISSAAAAGGPAKKMTREEIMKMTDPVERHKAIAANPDLLLE